MLSHYSLTLFQLSYRRLERDCFLSTISTWLKLTQKTAELPKIIRHLIPNRSTESGG